MSQQTQSQRAQSQQAQLKKLQWRSRRGLLELDLILVPFASEQLPSLDADGLRLYDQLLDCEDPHLLAWLRGDEQPAAPHEAHLRPLIERIRRWHFDRQPS